MIRNFGITSENVNLGIRKWREKIEHFFLHRLLISWRYGVRMYLLNTDSWVVKYRLLKGLSRMMGNYHVRFLGGKGP